MTTATPIALEIKDGVHTGVLIQLSGSSQSEPLDPDLRRLKARAKRSGYSLLKQMLVDQLKVAYIGAGHELNEAIRFYPELPLLEITISECGSRVIYRTYDEIPETDVPCPCGNPNHWMIQYRDLIKKQGGKYE